MKGRPHIGNTKRNLRIFQLYDTGEYSLKEIASQITANGWHCTVDVVEYALKQRSYYQKHYGERRW